MNFRRAGDFLKKFRGLVPQELLARDLLSQAIQEVCGVPVTPADIRLRGTIAHLKVHPAAKSEILLKRLALLRAVARKSPERALVTEIR